MKIISENNVQIKAELPQKDVNRKMPVFYNPVMKSNRNISVLLLNSVNNKEMKIADPLAGSGIRSLRFLKELKKDKIKELFVNDFKEDFIANFNENLTLNNLKSDQVQIHNEEASLFLLNQAGFDYIELDPFGTPNPFLPAAVARISRNGILAVTATDTAALTGTYPKVTKRKYWATVSKSYMMHEIGLRILIRKIQLQGIQFDKAFVPILSYHKDHYFRVYFRSEKGKEKCDELIKEHLYLLFCPKCLNYKLHSCNCGQCDCGEKFKFSGPLWGGKLFDSLLLKKMVKENVFPEEQKFLELLSEEAKEDLVGFYDLHIIAKKNKKNPGKLIDFLKKHKGVRTHFSLTGVKSKNKNIING